MRQTSANKQTKKQAGHTRNANKHTQKQRRTSRGARTRAQNTRTQTHAHTCARECAHKGRHTENRQANKTNTRQREPSWARSHDFEYRAASEAAALVCVASSSRPPKMLARWRCGRGDAQDGGGRERGNLGPMRAESGSLLGWLTCFQRLRVVSRYMSPGQLQDCLLRRNEQQGAMAQWQRV